MGSIVSRKAFLPPPPSYSSTTFHSSNILYLPQSSTGSTSSSSTFSVPVLYYPSSTPQSSYTILFSHGNAEDLGLIYPFLSQLSAALSVNVVSYDYPGYGLHSAADPSEQGCYDSIYIVYNWIINTLKIKKHKIILMGRSLGSGPTIELAKRLSSERRMKDVHLFDNIWTWTCGINTNQTLREEKEEEEEDEEDDDEEEKYRGEAGMGGVVIQSGIASCIRVVSDSLALVPIDIFVNIDKIDKVSCPVRLFLYFFYFIYF